MGERSKSMQLQQFRWSVCILLSAVIVYRIMVIYLPLPNPV